ncbi:isopentenyl-diphosphate Delta-isomerase [Herbiconiux sp. L3-i23]|uniref:isopentenyl-diphosphate Delta-isomerase n=1 Tax=Herbiconiux sp. L3-i23 TaxID=2905871 RepID=UPI00204A3E62|nr:isopentenyl-diphosphate Delta-isomerase [Herbiconiux sp. L3-i23]BDI24156.1 isopentenyl-diphosphate Delta-isomerase [Herbiconiux sp. L3-i23]
MTRTESDEQVVLLDAAGSPIGIAPKASVHDDATPLHLAFSCHVSDAEGRLLVTRRALHKRTWPGVWTNSFCGHPGPDEAMEDAVRRRGRDELGIELEDLRLVLPDFRYRAVDASGVVENEVCPVYRARIATPLSPNHLEVMDYEWVDEREFAPVVAAATFAFSPWLALQFPELAAAEALARE